MANSIDHSNALHRTCAPVDEVVVQSVDEARLRGRRKLRVGIKLGEKQPTQVSPAKLRRVGVYAQQFADEFMIPHIMCGSLLPRLIAVARSASDAAMPLCLRPSRCLLAAAPGNSDRIRPNFPHC